MRWCIAGLLVWSACSDPIPSSSDAGTLDAGADLVVVLPYMDPEVVETRMLEAQPGILDVHFSVDTTGSFEDEINVLETDLQTRLIPELERRVNDVAFGVSSFQDFPIEPFGAADDLPYELLTALTTNPLEAQMGVEALELGNGSDLPESGYEALYQIATGEGLGDVIAPYTGTGLGGVGFREGAFRVVVHITDAESHTPATYGAAVPDAHGEADVVAAMGALDIAVVGIASGADARPQLEQLALQTGAVVAPIDGNCPTGIDGANNAPVDGNCPQVFDINSQGQGLSDAVEDGLVALLDTVVYDEVFGRIVDDPNAFVQGFVAEGFNARGADPPTLADLRPEDGVDDTFQNVSRGTEIDLGIRLRNTSVEPAPAIQRFPVRLEIVGDEAIIEELTIEVVVPGGAGIPDRISGGGTFTEGACAAGGRPSPGWLLIGVMLVVRRRC